MLLTLCFWLSCYIVNTYLLLVLNRHHTFMRPLKLHMAQILFCLIAPLIFVGICLLVDPPGYNMLFKDRLAVLPSSPNLVFSTITIPVQLSFGVSLSLLVSIARQIRKVSNY